AMECLEEIFSEMDVIEFMIVENDLVVNRSPFKDEGLFVGRFIKKLRHKGITRLDIHKGIKRAEMVKLIAFLSRQHRKVPSLPHVKTGIVDVVLGVGGDTGDMETGLEELSSEQIERFKEITSGVSPFKELSIAGIEEIVIKFLVTMKREGALLRLLSPVKSYSEYTYTHATNVAVLSMFQAECLGLGDEFVHEIGIAGLLHDVGKLFVSREVLEKKGRLTDEEFEEIKRHTIYGALYLSKNDSLPQIAAIASLEHHLGFDGRGYPAFRLVRRRQHLCSQIVQIADFFDALRSRRPYKRDWDVKKTLVIMKEASNRQFNPVLVESFARNLLRALKG
ncbi:MAG: HD domain-containing protein, partial [Nitrospirae bacterium]|nr:HD domain-containing protein [Nitrospirota bacterium]